MLHQLAVASTPYDSPRMLADGKRHMLTFVVLAFCSLCAFAFSCALRKNALGGVRTGSNDAKLLPLPVVVAVGADWRRAFFLLPLFVFLELALASSSDDDSMR